MNDFAAIGFEGGQLPSRKCVCSIVSLNHQKISDTFYELIHPTPNYYCDWSTDIHDLTHRDTDRADPFPMVWQKIAPAFTGLPFVAHNSPFDEECLRIIFAYSYHGILYPDYEFFCTCRQSRKVFPKLPDHRLDTVARHLEVNLKNHHHALADALACAEIAKIIL